MDIIGVDPYYLTNKYKAANLIPSIILSGRKTNNDFHKFIARKVDEIIKDNNLQKKFWLWDIHLKKIVRL